MKTTQVYVTNYCVPCENRCKYCLLSYNGRESGVDYKRSEAYAKKFYDWIKENRPDLTFIFYWGYSMEHPGLLEAIDFCKSIGSPMGNFLQFDGMKFRSEDEIRDLLLNIKEHGIRLIDLTFYGTEEYHDRFAARKGDYAYMISILKVANQVGMPVTVDVPVSHENADQLDALMEKMEQYKTENLRFFVPHAEGRGVLLEGVRFSRADYEALSEKVKSRFNTNKFKTEKEWVNGEESFKTENRAVALTLTPENIELFEQMNFAETICYLEQLDEDYYDAVPSMDELIKRYGDGESELFYSSRDLYLRYQRMYIKEHNLNIYDVNDERQCFSRRF